MERYGASSRLIQAAALARIAEMGKVRHMTIDQPSDTRVVRDDDRQFKAAVRAMWASGDYHRFATNLVWEVGPLLVEACGVSAGQRVVDVAAGTGNVALRAAKKSARVVASDLTPE